LQCGLVRSSQVTGLRSTANRPADWASADAKALIKGAL
jgi:hypothetical protein